MVNKNLMKDQLLKIYQILFNALGPQDWWPGDTPLEICIGAILTQNTNWKNVEKAIGNLKNADILDLKGLYTIDTGDLAELIRPSGYYNIKAKRLKSFINTLFMDFEGNLNNLLGLPLPELRDRLLSIKGIGPETADSIILYAAEKPIFVIDAYTRRIFSRHFPEIPEDIPYHDLQNIFMDTLQSDTQIFNEYHALLVMVGKNYCRKNPRCEECPLGKDIL